MPFRALTPQEMSRLQAPQPTGGVDDVLRAIDSNQVPAQDATGMPLIAKPAPAPAKSPSYRVLTPQEMAQLSQPSSAAEQPSKAMNALQQTPLYRAGQAIANLPETVRDVAASIGAGAAALPIGAAQLGTDVLSAAGIGQGGAPSDFNLEDLRFALSRAAAERAGIVQEASKTSPIAAPLAEFATQAVQAAPLTPAGGTLLQNVRRIGAAGAALGAATPEQGLQPGEQALAERGKEAITSGAISGALPVIGKGVSLGARAAGEAAQVLPRFIKGRDADKVMLSQLGGIEGVRSARDALASAGKRGSILNLADVGGDETQGLLRSVSKVKGQGKIVSDYLESRSAGANERIRSELAKGISHVDGYFAELDDIAKARSEASAPLYRRAYEQGKQIANEKIVPFLKDERIQRAIKNSFDDYGVPQGTPINSLQMMDAVKKSLDDEIGKSIRTGANERARAYQGLKSSLVKTLDDAIPAYKQARQIFAGFSALEDAAEAGRKFSTMEPERLRMLMKDMGTAERDAFRIGVRENIQNTIGNVANQADPAKKVIGNENARARLAAIFPDKKLYNEFIGRMEDEITAAQTKFRALGGSRTDINVANDDQFLGAMVDVARSGGNIAGAAMNAFTNSLIRRYQGINQQTAKQLTDALLSPKVGQEMLDRILAQQKTPMAKDTVNLIINQYAKSAGLTSAVNTAQQGE